MRNLPVGKSNRKNRPANHAGRREEWLRDRTLRVRVLRVLEEFGATAEGLGEAAVEQRMQEFGRDTVVHEAAAGWRARRLGSLSNALIFLLPVLATVAALTRDFAAALIISTTVLISAVLRFTQEYRCKLAVEKFKEMVETAATVKRLPSIQDFGAMTLPCSDKTATQTQDIVIPERHLDAPGRDSEKVRQLDYLDGYYQAGLKNPLDVAILERAEREQGLHLANDDRPADGIPFDFERRRTSVAAETGKREGPFITMRLLINRKGGSLRAQ